jgi:hypothetical protein
VKETMNAKEEIVEVLKKELEFLNNGGYERRAAASWQPIYIFEDSPTCMNHDPKANPASCGECPLMQLVPGEFRSASFPCRLIPLNTAGETVESLYRYADDHEIEEAVRKWLQATIAELEEHRSEPLDQSEHLAPCGEEQTGTPWLQRAKCANPACPVLFDWHKGGKLGGKFFRFRESSNPTTQNANATPAGIHGVRHFWLCERCSHLFTLVYQEHGGVILSILLPELTSSESERELSAA